MTQEAVMESPTCSADTLKVLDLIAQGLRSGAQQVRSFALVPLEDCALRLDIIRNPRLSARIDARLLGAEGWALPDELDDFQQAQPLVALLQHGPSKVFRAIGFSWHGNSMARLLLSGDKELAMRLTKEELRQALFLRDKAQPDASVSVPSEADIDTDGELCIWCWMAALPGRVATLGLAVLLKHCCVYERYKALPEEEKARRASLAEAWLRTVLVPAEFPS
jgi:hypothetical protein